MKERIKEYMDYKSISAGELATRLDVQRSNISHILNGRNKPGAAFIEKLLVAYPDLDARWLFTGEGEMIQGTGVTVPEASPAESEEMKMPPQEKEEKSIQRISEEAATALNAAHEKPSVPNSDEKKVIDKVVILYSDGTFTDYKRK